MRLVYVSGSSRRRGRPPCLPCSPNPPLWGMSEQGAASSAPTIGRPQQGRHGGLPLRQETGRRLTLLATFIAAFIVAGCDSSSAGQSGGGALSVVASFYPLQYFAQRIGDNHVDVYNPVPPGAEPHDLELTPRSIERIQQARIFLYLGGGFQPAVDRALATVKGPNLIVKDVSEGIPRLPAIAEEGGDQSSSPASAVDPHIWLDPVNAQAVVSNTAATLTTADPPNATTYSANSEKLRAELAAVDNEYKEGLKDCKRKEIITSHAAFAYLAKRYGLVQVPITGISPEAEPSPARLQEIIKFAKDHDVKYIFFETLVEPKVAQVVAKEIGAQTLVLNPIEGLTEEQVKEGKDYMSIMHENLANLKIALECGQ